MDVQLKGRKLNEDEKAAAVKRLYEDEIKLKTQKHELLIKKVYREDDPKLISTTQLQESIVRQHDAEMKRREMKAKELKNKYYKIADPHRMANEEIEGSLQRVYTDSIRHKEDVHRKLEDKYSFRRQDAAKLSTETMKSSTERLSKPKKSTFSDDEINKIYGF